MTFDANAIFEDELARRELSFVQQDQDTYRVRLECGEVTANLANVRRNAERDQDPDAIRRFVGQVIQLFASGTPPWAEASKLLLWTVAPSDQEFGDSIRASVTDEVCRVLTLTDAEHTKITWVTPQMCDEWGVTTDQASRAAFVESGPTA